MKKLYTSISVVVMAMMIFVGTTLAYNPVVSNIPSEATPPHIWLLSYDTNSHWQDAGEGAVMKMGDSYLAMFMVAVETQNGHTITVEFSPKEKYTFPLEVSFFPEGAVDSETYEDYGNDLSIINRKYGVDTKLALAVVGTDSELWHFVGRNPQSIYLGSVEHNRFEDVMDVHLYMGEERYLHKHSSFNSWQTWVEVMDDWFNQKPYDHYYTLN